MNVDPSDECPRLPNRLLDKQQYDHPLPQLVSISQDRHLQQKLLDERSTTTTKTMSHEHLMGQMTRMAKTRFGTMGDTIMMCHRNDHTTTSAKTSPSCYGVVKIFRFKSVYDHTKRCLTMLHDEDFVPNLLYSNDTTLTIVEEDRGQLTMMNSPVPIDFDVQLRYVCHFPRAAILHNQPE